MTILRPITSSPVAGRMPGRGGSSPPGTTKALAFQTQPSAAATSGVALAQQPIVRALNDAGQTDATYTGTVTIGASGSVLSGTVARAAVAGVATFTDLVLTGAGAATLTASAVGKKSVVSTGVTVT